MTTLYGALEINVELMADYALGIKYCEGVRL